MLSKIWLIGGTQESAVIAKRMVDFQLPCLISVTTESAGKLYPSHPILQVWVGTLSQTKIPEFLIQNNIAGILDASHPYATEISQLAITAATQNNLPYLRYERPSITSNLNFSSPNPAKIAHFDSFESFLKTNYLRNHRVLLTLGYRPLSLFQPYHNCCVLYARILPSLTALQAAIDAGFTPDKIIALRPPISVELETALWQQWQISLVVTKASGTPGGEDIKRQVAIELGVSLIIIDRPKIEYPRQTDDLDTVLNFCRQCLSKNNSQKA
jgi:precorrin-6A/cobalt-precorrin-6A reductase